MTREFKFSVHPYTEVLFYFYYLQKINDFIFPTLNEIRDLGIYTDLDTPMKVHVS